MVFYQLDLARIIQVYIVQGSVAIFFVILAYKILKRDTKRLNLMFSCFYLSITIGLIVNIIYVPLTIEAIVLVLYYITIFFILLGPIFLLVVELMLLKSEKVINTTKQLTIILIYAIALSCMIFIPNGVTINSSTEWKPVWSIPYFIYTITVLTVGAIVPSLYFSYQIYKQFEDEKLKKKWGYFIIGLYGLIFLMYGTLTSNTLNDQTFRTVWAIISLFLITVPPYLVYYGVGKELEAD
ncbi:MAG: hypothetical protein ACFFDK_09145 [Promethearchaeota archaeon]